MYTVHVYVHMYGHRELLAVVSVPASISADVRCCSEGITMGAGVC